MKKWAWQYTCLLIVLSILAWVTYFFQIQIIYSLRCFFQLPQLNLVAGGAATLVTIVHKIKTRKFVFSPTMSFNEFKIPVEDLLSFVSNPITLVCALSLAKGLFLQLSEKVPYFPFFNELELAFIGLITAYLLFISLMEFWKHLVEINITVKVEAGEVNAISEKEFKEGEIESITLPKK